MIKEYEASEFISMVILNEYAQGKNKVEMPYEHITNMARLIERKDSGIRINLSSDSIQSYFARTPKEIYIKNNLLYVDDIKNVYNFLSHYASEDSLYKIQ
jgi:hypothetical protein